jgi:hypothetical protein
MTILQYRRVGALMRPLLHGLQIIMLRPCNKYFFQFFVSVLADLLLGEGQGEGRVERGDKVTSDICLRVETFDGVRERQQHIHSVLASRQKVQYLGKQVINHFHVFYYVYSKTIK